MAAAITSGSARESRPQHPSAPTVAVMAPGSMGAAIGRTLVAHGLEVSTCIEGRSAATATRASAAGLRCVPFAELADVDIVLSIVPPSIAVEVATELAASFASRKPADATRFARRKPLYVDCNAIAPRTVLEIASVIEAAGGRCVDAGIVGGPPAADGAPSPVLYASGEHASALAALTAHGLDIRILAAPIGSASALKMCIAGVSKGMTAVFALTALAATQAGVATAFREQLQQSHPALLAWTARQASSLSHKSYRWVTEMQELSQFLAPVPGAPSLFAATADFYAWTSQPTPEQQAALADLERFFN